MLKSIAGALALLSISACASLEPEPCSAEWVQWKTDRVLGSFAADNRGLINDLRDFSENLDDPGPLTMMRMASKLDDFRDLATDFQSNVMPELEAAIDQCGTPAKFVPAFTSFLRDEGVEEDMLDWIELIGEFAVSRDEA
ncbi:MAG: hypothetical protein AAFQ21_10405 [Pseudomonadota bacterium]